MLEALFTELAPLGLSLPGWLTLGVVAAATLLMAFEKLGPDLVMFCAVCVLVAAGVVTPEQGLTGFSEPATVTIGVLFVVARALQDSGGLVVVSRWVYGTTRSATRALLRLILPVAGLSAVLNNTPIVAMFIPVASGFATRVGVSPSRFLMPLSFAAMLGGTCTLIGTSTNLVVSDLMQRQGLAGLGMFELTWVGLPTTLVGVAYLATVGQRVVATRRDAMSAAADEVREFLAEVEVAADSPLVGRTVEEAGLRHLPGLFLVEIRRGDEVVRPVAPEDHLLGGDHLVFTGAADTIQDLAAMPGLTATGETPDPGRGMFQVVVSDRGRLHGRTVRASNFRRRFGAAILAVHRAGERIEGKIGDIVLRGGDTLLLTAAPGFDQAYRHSRDFYLVSEVEHEGQPRYRQAPVALLALAMMVALPTFTELSMTVSSMAALVVLLATRCIAPRSAREAVQWPVLVLIGSAFGLAEALTASGAAQAVADLLIGATASAGPLALLAGVYLLGVAFSSFISNAAAAAVLFPITMSAAVSAGLDPRPFAVALTMAASAAFSTPIGYQTNLLVYGPGGYRYLDFVRAGLPLNLLCFLTAMVVVPWMWPLVPA